MMQRSLILLAAGAFALATLPAPAQAAPAQAGATEEFSAQAPPPDKKGPPKRAAQPARPAPRVAAPPRQGGRVVGPNRGPGPARVVGPNRGPGPARVVTPGRGPGPRVISAGRLRAVPRSGVGRFAVRGHNYSAWRSGYRIRRGNGWRTFVGLSVLGAIAVGGARYYPYAYLDAPQPLCSGLTEDGCEMRFQPVETVEGDVIPTCVAYCPWQD